MTAVMKQDAIIVLGDHDTGRRADVLAEKAAEHGAVITEIHAFDPGQAGSHDDLAQVDVVNSAESGHRHQDRHLGPISNGGSRPGQHVRRLSLVLQRHGLNLVMGPGLWPYPITGGMNEADFALRREVQAVDDLDHAALAAVGFKTLGKEIELALAGGCTAQPTELPPHRTIEQLSEVLDQLELECGPRPMLPAASAAWPERQPARRYATWLVSCCGLTQTDAAKFINASGHRTPQGRIWQQATVSALISADFRGAVIV